MLVDIDVADLAKDALKATWWPLFILVCFLVCSHKSYQFLNCSISSELANQGDVTHEFPSCGLIYYTVCVLLRFYDLGDGHGIG